MNKLASLLLSVVVISGVSGCADVLRNPSKDYAVPIELRKNQQERMTDYHNLSGPKAFAVSQNGYWSYAAYTLGTGAIRASLAMCQGVAKIPCRIHISNTGVDQLSYKNFASASLQALAELRAPKNLDYHEEAIDWGVPSTAHLKGGSSESYDGPTPLTLPGVHTLRTSELVKFIKKMNPALIDAQGWNSQEKRKTIPNSYLIDWVGTRDGDVKHETLWLKNFDSIMQSVEPDKTKPLVIFCESSQCWMSVNTIFQLQAIGYTNIYWYRGGILAWVEAGLPSLDPVPYATIWSE